MRIWTEEMGQEMTERDFTFRVISYQEGKPHITAVWDKNEIAGDKILEAGPSRWRVSWELDPMNGRRGVWECRARFQAAEGNLPNAKIAVGWTENSWNTDHYVLMPAAALGGNRFRCIKRRYPPMLHKEDGIGVTMPITMPDAPHLQIGKGVSRLHFRAGDLATPCMGYFSPDRQTGLLVLTLQDTKAGYTGLLLEEAEDRNSAFFQLDAPAVRERVCRLTSEGLSSEVRSDDAGYDFQAGDTVEMRFRLYEFPCRNVEDFYEYFFQIRQEMSGETILCNDLPFSAAFAMIEEEYLKNHWNKKEQFIRLGSYEVSNESVFLDWQAGWVGGGINSFAFQMEGSLLSRERAAMTMDTIFTGLQAPNGWVYPIKYGGRLLGDDFDHQERWQVLLVRKDADILLFGMRQILMERKRGNSVPCKWLQGIERLADAFVRLWEKYGQFGQFIDLEQEEILIGGTAGAGVACGGLALAAGTLGNKRYLEVAQEAGHYYLEQYVRKGVINGGPGDILQAPDSESAFGLLEAYVVLYETTGRREWLEAAQSCARQCASWCVSYDFHFPEGTEFGRLGIKTTGSVYASVVNKHSAPGICVGSGLPLLKLFYFTGDRLYLRLCREIAHNITQYLSMEGRQIQSWSGPYLKPGWMCERVNMSDWESKDRIGGVFNGSSPWCVTACLLTYCEIPGILFLRETGEAICFDHVEACVEDLGGSWKLTVKNPTAYDATVKLLVKNGPVHGEVWGESTSEDCMRYAIGAGSETEIILS